MLALKLVITMLAIGVIAFVFTFIVTVILEVTHERNREAWWSFPLYMALMLITTLTALGSMLSVVAFVFNITLPK